MKLFFAHYEFQGDKLPESPEEIIKETKAEENEDNAGKGKC